MKNAAEYQDRIQKQKEIAKRIKEITKRMRNRNESDWKLVIELIEKHNDC